MRGLERASESLVRLIRMRQSQGLGQRPGSGVGAGAKGMQENVIQEKEMEREKERLEQELRLNLIALAKRAPLDMIAKMRKELLPEHLRGVVPTLD